MKLLSKFFHDKEKEPTKIASGDSFINTEVIINTYNNFIILISFTEDYFHDMIEFMSTCVEICKHDQDDSGSVKYVHSSYDEDSGKKDTHDDPIYIVHNRHYLLIGGDDDFYLNLFYRSDNIANSILEAIKSEIIKYRNSLYYQILINDMIITEPFRYDKMEPEYDEEVIKEDSEFPYTDPSLLMSKLPNCFNVYDIIPFIAIDYCDNGSRSSLYEEIWRCVSWKDYVHKQAIMHICESLFKNDISYDTLKSIIGPKYLVQDEDAMPGDVCDESLDELFRQKYESVGVLRSDNIEYTDIDETLSDEPIDDTIDNGS